MTEGDSFTLTDDYANMRPIHNTFYDISVYYTEHDESDQDEGLGPDGKMPRDALTNGHVMAYSVGHLNNDLGAAMFASY